MKDHPRDPPRRQDPAQDQGSGLLAGGVLLLTTCPGGSWPSPCLQTPCKAPAGCCYLSSIQGTGSKQAGQLGTGGSSLGETPNHPAQPGEVVGEPQGRDFCHAFVFHLAGPAAWVRPEAWEAPVGIAPAEPQLLVGASGEPPHPPPRAPNTPLQPPDEQS